MSGSPTLVWFRQDLRLEDNPALKAAGERGRAVIPVFICDPNQEGKWSAGAASRWWLHHSLAVLDAKLRARGGGLVFREGDTLEELKELINATGAGALYFNRRYEPMAVACEAALLRTMPAPFEVQSFNASLLYEPWTVSNKQGAPFQVFTPFWRHCLERDVEQPSSPPEKVKFEKASSLPPGVPLETFALRTHLSWENALEKEWKPGEEGALRALKSFAREYIEGYDSGRNFIGQRATSRLSPHLHFGEIGPRQIWAALKNRSLKTGVFPDSQGVACYLTELGWREFAHHLLYHFPQTPVRPLREKYLGFPWRENAEALAAWKAGKTGYPIVDAGMRELWATGWMHNRARMIVASFLVKHLRLSWQEGARWFWDTLVDADLAANTLGWQWSAGCGADAAPYFRIFNPILQGAKFDSEGNYVRRWIPELSSLPDRYLHCPWRAPAATLSAAGVKLGNVYPLPVVDHATARREALAAFSSLS